MSWSKRIVQACPRCGTQTKEGFGLVTCGSCGNLFVIDEPESFESTLDAPDVQTDIQNLNPDEDVIDDVLPRVSDADSKINKGEHISSSWQQTTDDIQNFSDSHQALNMGGNVRYDLCINVSRAPDELGPVVDVLADDKLRLDKSIIAELSKNLNVTVKNLNSLKAIYILRSLDSLDVQIKWESYDSTED